MMELPRRYLNATFNIEILKQCCFIALDGSREGQGNEGKGSVGHQEKPGNDGTES